MKNLRGFPTKDVIILVVTVAEGRKIQVMFVYALGIIGRGIDKNIWKVIYIYIIQKWTEDMGIWHLGN